MPMPPVMLERPALKVRPSVRSQPAELELTILMPCLNEAETLAVCIRKALGFLRRHAVAGEVLIADNGSTDGSQQIARELGARVVQVDQKGYGSALMGGIEAARGRYVIMGDADDSYDFEHLMPFVERLRQGYELVMGNRFKGGIAPGAMPKLHRWLGNPVLTALGRLFFWRPPIRDFHCGLRGFARDSVRELDLQTTGMEFASEMVVKAILHDQRIIEVPTTLSPDGRTRPPHLRSWRDGWRHLRFLLMYSPRWLFFYPGVLVMLVGMLAGLWLLPGPRTIGPVTLDVHTMLYAGLAVLVGFQMITFGIFTKIFAVSEGLLPEGPRLEKAFKVVTLETGLIAGAGLMLMGVAGTAAAVWNWEAHQFGPLNPREVLRLVIPSGVAFTLGVQVVLSSFFLSVLGLKRRGRAT